MIRLRWLHLAAIGLVLGLGGQSLLLLRNQCRLVEGALRQDFRLIVFLQSGLSPNKIKIVEEKIMALPHSEEVVFVSQEQALSEIQSRNPEAGRLVALLGGRNPFHPAFEVRLSVRGMAGLQEWLRQAGQVPGVEDVRYKSLEAKAILQARFYRKLLTVALNLCFCVLMGIFLLALGARLRRSKAAAPRAGDGAAVLWSGSGAAAALGLAALAVWPARGTLFSYADFLSLSQVFLLLAAALSGWGLNEGMGQRE